MRCSYLIDNNRCVFARVVCNLPGWLLEGVTHDLNALLLIIVGDGNVIKNFDTPKEIKRAYIKKWNEKECGKVKTKFQRSWW